MNLLIFNWTGECERKPSVGASLHSHMNTATPGRICHTMYVQIWRILSCIQQIKIVQTAYVHLPTQSLRIQGIVEGQLQFYESNCNSIPNQKPLAVANIYHSLVKTSNVIKADGWFREQRILNDWIRNPMARVPPALKHKRYHKTTLIQKQYTKV